MNIKQFLAVLGISLLLIAIMDGAWLGFFQKKTWKEQVKDIQGSDLKLRVEFGFIAYILMMIVPLTILQVSDKYMFNIFDDILLSVVFALVLYGVYNNTNRAIFDKYTKVYLTDWIWGTFMFSFVTIVSVSISKRLR